MRFLFLENNLPALQKVIAGSRDLKKKLENRFPEILEGDEAIKNTASRVRRETLIRVRNKLILQHIHGLRVDPDAILFTMIHRITDQKGFQLLLEASEEIFKNLGYEGIIGGQVAAGDLMGEEIARGLKPLQSYFPDQVSVNIGFLDVRIPIYASDVFLMPSMNEPGGISQLEAMICGCIVVARATGGLRDTIRPIIIRNGKIQGDGFLFSDYSPGAFYEGMKRCADFFHNVTDEQILQARRNAQRAVHFWDRPAEEYRKQLYDLKEIIQI